MDASGRPAQLLAEFIAAVSTSGTEAAAALAAVEHAAETLGAEAAAIVRGGEVVAATGYPEGAAPIAELEGVRPGAAGCWLEVPGAGPCAAAAAALEYPPGATLVVGRPGSGGLTREETGLLRGMARVAAMTMRVLSVLDGERSAREELERLAFEQAALRRVATLVAKAVSPEEVFAAVAAEVGSVLPAADIALVGRYDFGQVIEFVGGWRRVSEANWVGHRVNLGGRNVATLVFESGEPARVEHLADDATAATAVARGSGARSSAGAPISVGGRLWGVMTVGSVREGGLPAGIEHRLAGFTELAATAIANAQARVELRGFAREQAALRRIAVLVARAAPPEEVFAAVAVEVGRLIPADFTVMSRYDPDDALTVVGAWASSGAPSPIPVGHQRPLGGRNVVTQVVRTGRPARIDNLGEDAGRGVSAMLAAGVRSAIGVPISVEGRLWGVISAASGHGQSLPADTEERLEGFTELVATAIANAQARVELRGYAEEQAALRRVATLVARGEPPAALFAAIATEVSALFNADTTGILRFEPGGEAMLVGVAGGHGKQYEPGARGKLPASTAAAWVQKSGRAARIDADDPMAEDQSAVSAPIVVKSRLWGVIGVALHHGCLPPDTVRRMAGFTELAATAIANAEAHAELTASRARIVATADETRRRIEHDLHDGAQQRLVSLALRLRMAQAAVPAGLSDLSAELGRVSAGLTDTLDELREYARGIHPAILTERGLVPALKALVRRSPVPVTLDVRADTRLPERIEVTAYYIVSEALTNAAKHASASAVRVTLNAAGGVVRLSVGDDGVGGADPAGGSGLVGLKDRIEAIGGTLIVQSGRGEGTCLVAELPAGAGPPPNPG